MKNRNVPSGPIGRDFEFLVEELPYWTRKTFYPSMQYIDNVRKALKAYETTVEKQPIA